MDLAHRCLRYPIPDPAIFLSPRRACLPFHHQFFLAWLRNCRCIVSGLPDPAFLASSLRGHKKRRDYCLASFSFGLSAEPHPSQQIILDDELVIQRCTDVQSDQQNQ